MAAMPEGAGPSSERFELRGELGSGGMGIVYRVFDRQRGAEVALKVLKARGGVDLFRFKREFRALADLRHRNLVELHELFTVHDDWMFTMELVLGVPFNQWVRPTGTHGPLDEDRLRDALAQIADGLAAIHAIGKVHRDVKPSNIVVEPGGRAVVLDFGLVTGVEELLSTPTHDDVAVGTPAYMSPEQISDLPLSGASDLYSVGTMLYEALTGRRPYDGPRAVMLGRKLTDAPLAPSRFGPVPADLERLCLHLMAREASDRPDALAVLEVLGKRPTPPTSRPAEPARPRRSFEPELAILRQALADCRDHYVLAVVFGPRGSGKSTLLDGFRAELAGTDAVVLSGRAATREDLLYRAADQLVDQLSTWLLNQPRDEVARLLPANIAALTRVFPVLQRVPGAHRPLLPGMVSTDAGELQRQAGEALLALVSGIARERPLVLLADDGHHGTEAGEIMTARLDAVAPPGCLFVVTHASEHVDTWVVRLVATSRADLRRIDLPGPPALE